MPRRPKTPEPAAPPQDPVVPTIDPNSVYFADTFRRQFRLRASTVRREFREGRLRLAKRAGRYFLLGEWILEWLRNGELKPRPERDNASV